MRQLQEASNQNSEAQEAEGQDNAPAEDLADLGMSWGCRSVEATAAYSSFLREEVLAPSDADPSAGFSLHVADIIIPELLSACEDAPVPAPALQVPSTVYSCSCVSGKCIACHRAWLAWPGPV